jgi:beta-fructofuranosidase
MDLINYKPADGWAADFIPFHWQNEFHLFYLKDYRDISGHGEGTPWYHLVTKDFIHFTDRGECLPRGGVDEQDLYVFTGSVIRGLDGQFHLFYTGHNPHFAEAGKPVQAILHAVSKDLDTWKKLPGDIYSAPTDHFEPDDWRDPFVYWNGEAGEYWMLATARLLDGPTHRRGCTTLSTSRDLHSWIIKDIYYEPNLYSVHECPDYFRWGNWRYLLFSEGSDATVTRYRMAQVKGPGSSTKPLEWLTPKVDTFDARAFYAAKTATDGKNRYLFGWNPTREQSKDDGRWEWGGNLAVHQLVQEKDGTLSVKAPDSIAGFFKMSKPVRFSKAWGKCLVLQNGVRLEGTKGFCSAFAGELPQACKIDLSFNFLSETQGFGVMLRIGPDYESGYTLRIEPQRQRLVFDSWPRPGDLPFMPGLERPLEVQTGKPVHMQIYVNDSLAEVYVDDKVALSVRMYDHPEGEWGIFASQGQVDVTGIQLFSE